MAWTTPKTDFAPGDILTAAQVNAIGTNLDAIGGAWTSFTPSWTNLTPGNGTADAAYIAAGKLYVVRVMFTFGSTSAMGTGPIMTLPNASSLDAGYSVTGWPLGIANGFDTGTNLYAGQVMYDTATTVRLRFQDVTGTYLVATTQPSATVPFTWTTGDRLAFQFVYEAA